MSVASRLFAVGAIGAAWGGSNSRVPWDTYLTDHFKIVFHDDVKPQADLAKDFLEQAYARISADLAVRERGIRITVVLTGLPDESNGVSMPLGHRIVVYTRPAQVIASGEIAWLKRVLAHELAHQLTFLALRKSFLGIYSELYKTFHLPVWFVEGVAQYESETWDAKRNTFFAHALYNSAWEPYPNLATYTKQDPISGRMVYEQGHAFVRFLMHRQGQGFLGVLLKRITVIPLWTEFKALLSPITASFLPLESALRAKTGLGIRALYAEFLASMRAGMPPGGLTLPEPVLGGFPGFAAVFQIKEAAPSVFVFTGQKTWDQPHVSLYVSKHDRTEKIGPDFVNPVFDVSPDGKWILYVRSYRDPYGDPVQKLFLMKQDGGSTHFLSDGAGHPIFLGNDSIAYSHYRNGRQALVYCSHLGPRPACREAAADSLVGFYALSRSRRGILCNATDVSGRTGVYEYSPGVGFSRLVMDTTLAEFPVEAADSSVWMLRERGGLLQVDAWDRGQSGFSPVTRHPLGTFYLHRMAPGKIASAAQTGVPGRWQIMPMEVRPSPWDQAMRDSILGLKVVSSDSLSDISSQIASSDSLLSKPAIIGQDSIPGYRSPGYLTGALPVFDGLKTSMREVLRSPYASPWEMRPLIAWPTIYADFPSGGFGGGVLLEDPLELHTLALSAADIENGPGYDLTYTNRQTPVEFDLTVSNLTLDVRSWFFPPPGWDELHLVERISEYSLRLRVPMPWDIPVPHHLVLGLKAEGLVTDYWLAGADTGGTLRRLDSWSLQRKEFLPQVFLAYIHEPPYAYSAVHPLLFTDLEGGYVRSYPDDGDIVFWHARQTVPLWGELTATLWYWGQWNHLDFHYYSGSLPDTNTFGFFLGREQGYDQNVYAGLEFPIHKGYIVELPLFGLWNYLGGSFFGGAGREAYREKPNLPGSGVLFERKELGGKLVLLFHPLRRFPLVMSQSMQYDFIHHDWKYLTQAEFAGLPSAYSFFPNRKKSLGSGRKPMPWNNAASAHAPRATR